MIATPCRTVHTINPLLHPLVLDLHHTSARPVSASAWGIAPRGANANKNRQAKALKGKKDSVFDGQSQIGMDKLKIAQLICHCVVTASSSVRATATDPAQATNLKRIVADFSMRTLHLHLLHTNLHRVFTPCTAFIVDNCLLYSCLTLTYNINFICNITYVK